jgi:hypothetical protein
MTQTAHPSYETWIAHCFDHPVTANAWYLAPDTAQWNAPAELTLAYLSRLFNTPMESVGKFSDEQLNQGFWYLVSNNCSDHMYLLVDASLPEASRLACLHAMKQLFGELFFQRCSNLPSHGKPADAGLSALNGICYMWWDLMPIHGEPNDPRRAAFDAAVLTLMRDILGMGSFACQESALHGLGHWSYFYRAQVRQIIDHYLHDAPENAVLGAYARLAADGKGQ